MTQTWKTVFLFIITCSLFACDSSSSPKGEEEVESEVLNRPLQSGLWLPENSTSSAPMVWIIDAANKEVLYIDENRSSYGWEVETAYEGGWEAPGGSEVFLPQKEQLKLITDSAKLDSESRN